MARVFAWPMRSAIFSVGPPNTMSGWSSSGKSWRSPPHPGMRGSSILPITSPHARDGDPEPIEIEDTETTFSIGWKGQYRVEGAAFIYTDWGTKRTTAILGYPTHKLAAMA